MNRVIINFFIIVLFWSISASSYATDQQINTLIQSAQSLSIPQKITQLSADFLGAPYLIEPLGEGETGKYNQEPLYRLDAFDCQTYVETVIALTLAKDPQTFKMILNKIRYQNGQIAFITRNHFPSSDWLPNNQKNGYIKDITQTIAGADDIAVSRAYIDKRNWYQHLASDRVKLSGLSTVQKASKLLQLRAENIKVQNTWASIIYIPISKLLIKQKLNATLANKIPAGAILLIVNHPMLPAKLGTDMNVSHMGFAIWKNGILYLRAASLYHKEVIDIPLETYLNNYLPKSDKTGISIWKVENIRIINTA